MRAPLGNNDDSTNTISVLTASLETSVAGRAMEAGARGALSKVVSMPETVEAIERLFDAPIEGQR